MKKIVLILILALVMSVSAFAYHPSGWGVGIVGRFQIDWDNDFGWAWGPTFSLKAPQLPIYWGINMAFRQSGFSVGLTGDFHLFDESLNADLGIGWYLGLGAYVSILQYGQNDWTSLRFGARVPIGIYIFPVNFLEVFLGVAPSLGVGIGFGNAPSPFNFPSTGIGFDMGVRFWL